jgi:hypothetical protein
VAGRYRIETELDPSGITTGKEKVRQDLRQVDAAANTTKSNLTKAFNGPEIDRAMAQLAMRLEGLEGAMRDVSATTAQSSQTNQQLAATLDRVATSQTRAAGTAGRQKTETDGLSRSQANLDAALKRVLASTDAEAAEQHKLNLLLADAKRLLDAGIISQERYAQVQNLAANAGREQTHMMAGQRMGMQQLGFQLGDVATMYQLGARPAQIFASQIGQITQAVQLMSGGTSKFASFLGGPWGIALSLGLIALAPFVGKLFESGDALDESTDKLRKDAQETENTRQAKEVFGRTVEGVTAALRDNREALDKLADSGKTAARQALEEAVAQSMKAKSVRETTKALLEQARVEEQAVADAARFAGTGGDAAQVGVRRARERVTELDRQIEEAEKAVTEADAQIQEALSRRVVELGDRSEVEKIGDRYDALIDKTRARALEEGKVGTELFRQVEALRDQRDAEVKLAQERNRASNRTGPAGVSTFRSREQAIGIAGRELQQRGLRVGENVQFGGVRGNHPGMGNEAHGKFAIDVDVEGSDSTPTAPNIRSKYDQLARSYQQRGYKVLWAGWVYDAGGNGPTRRIPAGQDQHYGHMHVEAPQTIIGKPTQAGADTAARQEENAAERQGDFIQRVVDQAATRGVPQAQSLTAQMEKVRDDFRRQFDRDMDFGEWLTVGNALSSAQAREIAQNFDEAYVKPLARLRELQGKTGIEREIANRQLMEQDKIGRQLTETEKALIDTATRDEDLLNRKGQILEEVHGPLEEYATQLRVLNELLNEGAISQTEFNARVGDLGAQARDFKGGLSGTDSQGRSFADQADREEAESTRDEQLAQLETFLEQGTILEGEAAAIRLAIWRDYQNRLKEVDAGRLDNARSFFNQLSGLQNSKIKELAVVGKAAAITTATIDAYVAINKALATLPPPFNIAMAAAIGATALANVASIAGLKDGGWVRGPGGPRDDRVPIRASSGEFMVNAAAASRNAALLEAINSGASVGGIRRVEMTAGASGGAGRGGVQVHNYAGVEVETRENLSTGEVEVMIGRAIAKETPRLVARQLQDPSSPVSKSLRSGTTAKSKVT